MRERRWEFDANSGESAVAFNKSVLMMERALKVFLANALAPKPWASTKPLKSTRKSVRPFKHGK